VRLLVTGGNGFLGWHLRCLALSRGIETIVADRDDFTDPARLAALFPGIDGIVHAAGVNRGSDDEVSIGNPRLAKVLVQALELAEAGPPVAYADSIQSAGDSVYGVAKRRAAEILEAWSQQSGASFSRLILPNLFGEHGRPDYNSFVATFCHQVASGQVPEVSQDREIPLLHVQTAAAALLDAVTSRAGQSREVPGDPIKISQVRDLLQEFGATYATGEIPDISTPFRLAMFNSLRSQLFPAVYPIKPDKHSDQRGELFEAVRSGGSQGQVFVSTTVPGATRGEHFHLRKVERFLVIEGRAEIVLRRLFSSETVRFEVTGQSPAIIDMPTMWVHRLTNISSEPVTTLFWVNEMYDPQDTDTFARPTDGSETNGSQDVA